MSHAHLPTNVVNGVHDHAGLHNDANGEINKLHERLTKEIDAGSVRLDVDGVPYVEPALVVQDSPIHLDTDGVPFLTIGAVA